MRKQGPSDRRDRTVTRDGGFTLVEAVMAMAVFSVLATVALGAIVQTTRVTGSTIRRTAATNLAMRQIEAVRSLSAQSIPDGLQVSTQTVGGITYTIKQTARYSAAGATASLCSSGTSLAYKSVTVLVTWPNMGTVKPVRADTLRAVGVGTGALDQSTLGTLAVLVSGATGIPQSGVTIALSPGGTSQVTGDDGCVVFAGLAVGAYTASASLEGWSGVNNTRAAVSGSLGVTAATVSRGTLMYDAARAVEVRLGLPSTVTDPVVVPTGLSMQVGDSYVPDRIYPLCSGAVTAACTTGTPGTVQGLFPENYTITMGSCTSSASRAAVDLRVDSATTPVVTVPVGAVMISVQNPGGQWLVGRPLTVTSTTSGCSAGYLLSSADGGSVVALPYGDWSVSTPGTTAVTVSLSATSAEASVPLTVSS